MLFRTFIAGAVLTLGAVAPAQWVEYSGRELRTNPEPIWQGSTLMLPVRATADAIGASISHNGRTARIRWRDNTIEYSPGDADFYMNGRRRSLGGRSFERRGVLYAPSTLFEDLTERALRVDRTRRDRDYDRDRRLPNDRRIPDFDRRNPDNRYGETVYYNNRPLNFNRDEQPFRSGGTLLVPFRETARLLGVRTERPGDGLRVILYHGRNQVVYDKGRNWYRLNGRQINLPTSSRDQRDVYYVPIEVFDAVMDGRLSWDGRRR